MLKYKKACFLKGTGWGMKHARTTRKGLPERGREKRVRRYLPEEGWKRAASDSAVILAGSI